MLFDSTRKNENISEYLLYMWQVEDIVRACSFDIAKIDQLLIKDGPGTAEEKLRIRDWYQDIIDQMNDSGVRQRGHIEELQAILSELHYLHTTLLNVFQDHDYLRLYENALPHIEELRKKSNRAVKSDTEACLTGLYGVLLLRMQKKEISQDTVEAIKTLHALLHYLSSRYKEMKAGTLNFPVVKNN